MKKVFFTALLAVLCLIVNAQTVVPITASNGNTGDYTIFTASSATSLAGVDKPIILAEGFDMLNAISGVTIGIGLNHPTNNYLGNQLLNDGYDIIILNFADPLDKLEDNAALLVELIDQTNQNKQGSEQLIVGGVSMGGLIARYALTWMEANNQAHNTSLYISMDAPHKGANIPSSLQWLIKDVANFAPFPDLLTLKVALESDAAKQMLSVSPISYQPDAMHTTFFNNLTNLNGTGYPQNCKKIALANGSRNGTKNIFDQLVLCNEFNSTGFGGRFSDLVDIDVMATMAPSYRDNAPPPQGSTLVLGSTFLTFVVGQHFYTLGNINLIEGHDYAPGGRNSELCKTIIEELEYYNTSQDAEFSYADHFTFIPTVSALGIGTTNLFTDIQGSVNMCDIPFDAYYVPLENQEHTQITAISSNWLFDQIISVSQNNTVTIPANETYNFGANTNYYIHNNYKVEANASLKINGAGLTDYFNKNFFNGNSSQVPSTPSTSDYIFRIPSCKGAKTIEVEADGLLELGDNAGRTSVLIVESGNTLLLSGKLKINNESKVIIEEGAKLIVNAGNTVELNGANAVLEFQRGVLELNANAVFEPSGSGFVRFRNFGETLPLVNNKSIVSNGANTEVHLVRPSREKLLELGNDFELVVDHSLRLFKMEGITAELGSNSGIKLYNWFHVVNNKITKNPTNSGNYVHNGITVYSIQLPEYIGQNEFEYAKTGLKLISSSIYDFKIHFNDFNTCLNGIEIINAKAHIAGNNFTNCRYSVSGLALRNTLRFESNYFNPTGASDAAEGINIKGAAYPFVGLAGNVFKNIENAYYADNVNSTVKCNYFYDNDHAIWADRSGRLNLSNDEVSLDVKLTTGSLLTGGNNYFKIKRSGVMLVDFNALFPTDNVSNGYNTFDITTPSPLGAESYFTMRFNNTFSPSSFYTINNNTWLPVPPVNTSNPNIIEANFGLIGHFSIQESIAPAYIYGTQVASSAICPIVEWNDAVSSPLTFDPKSKNIRIEGSNGESNDPFVFDNGQFGGVTGTVTAGTYAGIPIITAYSQALNGILTPVVVEGSTKYNVSATALLNLANLLTVTYSSSLSNPANGKLFEYGYEKYIFYLSESEVQNIYSGSETGVNAQLNAAATLFTAVKTISNSFYSSQSEKLYSVKYRADLDKMKLFWMFKKYTDAETVLTTINQYVAQDEVNEVNFWSCLVGNEKQLYNEVIDWMQFEKNVSSCAAIYGLYDSPDAPVNSGGSTGGGSSQNTLEYTLAPNPAVTSITVSISMYSDADVSVAVFDKFGQQVVPSQNLGTLTTGSQTTTTVILSGLTADTYTMVVYADGVSYAKHFIKLTE